MTEFDAKRAIREEIASLTDIIVAISRRERYLEQQLAEMEVQHGAVAKLRGFASAELERKREVLRRLEEQG